MKGEKKMKKIKINGGLYDWDTIVSYMDDDIREQIHGELAPCTEEAFWARYVELDPENEILDIVSPANNIGLKWENYIQIDYETLYGEDIDEEQILRDIKKDVLAEVARQGGADSGSKLEYILLSNGGKIYVEEED
jgi:hypothetical protein